MIVASVCSVWLPTPSSTMAPLLGYWKLRGLAQYIRTLLEYTGTKYEEKLYLFDSEPSWPDDKFNLGLDFPNLPYYIDGNVKLTQSAAIMYYIGRKNNMIGKTDEEKMYVDMLVNQAVDMRMRYAYLVNDSDFEEKKPKYLNEDLPKTLKMLSDYLGDKTWVLGDQITIPDFIFHEVLIINLDLDKRCLDNYKNLQVYIKRFEELPTIKKYLASPRLIKSPVSGPLAKFGNK
ncbi:glutathione S-transferase Mu 2-like isoform X2 [Eriocheir sinensis]|uniref:glutathione S-transferase Mu 2-like isoform X2 n=1 Tax=Eriocheir sinensis TaxID=95602 RepID=UPI0021C84D56|nr:glutathione S-transferase Mu 2-like isoform X2 [Eriocheir sinensis]